MIDPLEEAELYLYAAWHAQAEDVIPSDKYQEMLTNFKTHGSSNQANGIFCENLFVGYIDRKRVHLLRTNLLYQKMKDWLVMQFK